jgi:prefoldin subunit 5
VKNKVLVEKISEDIKENVLKSIRKVLAILSRRLQELRKTHLSKEQALVKLKTMAGPDWRKRKLVFVISALETNRFDIKSNIDGLLEMINKLGKNV